MNILVLNYEYPPLGGGAAPIGRDLARFYAGQGHEVDVITMHFRGLPRYEEDHGVRIHRIRAWRRRQATCSTPEMLSFVAAALPFTRRYLKRERPDVIHCHFIVPTGLLAYLATRGRPVPYVITAHGSDVPGYNPDRFTFEHRFMTPLLRVIARNAACLTSPSRFLKNLIHENIGPLPVVYLPLGIDVRQFETREKKKSILMAGRLLPRKGFQDVLTALEGLDTDFTVHIAGDGPMRAQLEEQAKRLKMPVVFHGWVDQGSAEFRELFETASIMCLVSQKENSPVSLKEAMLTETAVITSNVSGCPEVVGDAGLVVTPGDVEAIRAALVRLIESEDLRRDLGRRGRERILREHDAENIGLQYLHHLEMAARR
jgi:glycosyltransferase involved in cell wall biosynthesis